jgi:hypothetical protein
MLNYAQLYGVRCRRFKTSFPFVQREERNTWEKCMIQNDSYDYKMCISKIHKNVKWEDVRQIELLIHLLLNKEIKFSPRFSRCRIRSTAALLNSSSSLPDSIKNIKKPPVIHVVLKPCRNSRSILQIMLNERTLTLFLDILSSRSAVFLIQE